MWAFIKISRFYSPPEKGTGGDMITMPIVAREGDNA